MKNIIFYIVFIAFLFCRNEKAEIKKEEQKRLSEKIQTEREKLIKFSDKFRTVLENRNLDQILDLLEDTVVIDECYFEKPNTANFFVGSYSFDKKKHSAEFLEGKGVLYSCLFDLSSLIQKKLAPPSIFSFSEFYRKSDINFYYLLGLKETGHSEDSFCLTAELNETKSDRKSDYLNYNVHIYENSQGKLQIKRFEIEIPAHPYYRINYDTAGASVPVIETIKNNDPKKLLRYFSDSVFYRSGGDGGDTIWFHKNDKKQISEFIKKKGKLYNIIFNTELGRKDGELDGSQKSFRDLLLNGVISKPLGPVCGVKPIEDRLLIFDGPPYLGAIFFACPRNNCNKCKIVGFSGDN